MRPLSPARGQRRVRSSMVLICVLAHALTSTSASAIDSHPVNATELAKQRFQEAKQAYQEERYSAAASLFEAADRLAPHASTRYNAATAWEQAGEEARAATGYEAVLALDSLDDARRATARERLQSLALRLGKLRIRERPSPSPSIYAPAATSWTWRIGARIARPAPPCWPVRTRSWS